MTTYERSMRKSARLLDQALDALEESLSNKELREQFVDHLITVEAVTARDLERNLQTMMDFLSFRGIMVKAHGHD